MRNLFAADKERDALLYTLRFYYFYPLLIAYSLCWIVYECYCFHVFGQRPMETYVPLNYVSWIFIPSFPSAFYFYSVATVGALSAALLLFKNMNNTTARVILFLTICWLNAFHWSFGFASHVGHVFLLFHFLTLFIPHSKKQSEKDTAAVAQMVKFLLCGIVLIYAWSAVWKVLTLLYKTIYQPEAMTWLSADSSFINAISGHIIMEENLGWKAMLFAIPGVWQLLFAGMLLFLLSVPFLVFRPKLLPFVFTILLLFHAVNFMVTRAEFVVVPSIYVLFLISGFLVKKDPLLGKE